MTDLVVKGDVIFWRVDVRVVPKSIEKLRAVRLSVDRFEQHVFEELSPLWTSLLGVDVDPFQSLPLAGQSPQRAEICKSVGADFRLGKDVCWKAGHTPSLRNFPELRIPCVFRRIQSFIPGRVAIARIR